MKKISVIALLVIGLTAGLFLGRRWLENRRIVKQIGSYTIRVKDIAQRDKVVRFYYPQEKRSLGLEQLERAYTTAQVLKNNGRPVTDAELAREETRIDKTTLFPRELARVKAIFGDDHDAYRRVFVLPQYVERIAYYDFFLRNPKLQGPAYSVAARFLEAAKKSPRQFATLAEATGHPARVLEVTPENGIAEPPKPKKKDDEDGPKVLSEPAPQAVQRKLQEDALAQSSSAWRTWKDRLSTVKPGEVWPRVSDEGETWLVVRYLGPDAKRPNVLRIEGVYFPKADFGGWLASERRKVDAG